MSRLVRDTLSIISDIDKLIPGEVIEADEIQVEPGTITDFNETSLCDSNCHKLDISGNVMIKPMKNIMHMKLIRELILPKVGKIAFEGLDFSPLATLEIMNISENELEEIPPGLENLQELEAGENQLSDDSSIKQLTWARRINLRNNLISEYSFDILHTLPMLQELDMTGNPVPGAGLFLVDRREN